MSWRERIATGQASFRGMPFFVDVAERVGGRRGVTFEYPFRDQTFREDLGRATRSFQVEGFVLGDEYLAARDRLIAALEDQAGPGVLVHPHYGTITVSALSWRVRESSADGGLARFSIEFEETPDAPAQPAASVDSGARLAGGVSEARDALRAAFVAAYVPGAQAGSLLDAVASFVATIGGAASKLGEDAQSLADRTRLLREVTDSVGTLVGDGAALAAKLEAVALVAAGDYRTFLALYDFDPGPPAEGETASRVLERANFAALHAFLQQQALFRAVETAAGSAFESVESAAATRAELCARIDEQAVGAADGLFQALDDLRALVVQAIPGSSATLPHVQAFEVKDVTPSLVLAQRIYGDISREEEIVSRNGIGHPFFVRGGSVVEVLTDG